MGYNYGKRSTGPGDKGKRRRANKEAPVASSVHGGVVDQKGKRRSVQKTYDASGSETGKTVNKRKVGGKHKVKVKKGSF